MNSHAHGWFFRLLSALLVAAAPFAVQSADSICLNAAAPATLEAPVEIAAATNAPVEFREKLEKGLAGETFLQIAQGKGYPPDVTTGLATYSFTIEHAGDYVLWCRVWWLDECGNSFSIHIGEAKPFIFGEDSTFKTWHWVRAPLRLKQLTLTPGVHTLTVRNREDGVALHQILLTRDKTYVPVDIEPVTVGEAP